MDRTIELLGTLEADTYSRAFDFIYHLRAVEGVPVVLTEGRRSWARQVKLYSQGRLTSGSIVTKTLRSKHLEGRAFDIAFYGYSLDAIPLKVWEAVGQIGEQFGLKWGGRWALRDYVHFEN